MPDETRITTPAVPAEPGRSRYLVTLVPLRIAGQDALNAAIPGLDFVALRELQILYQHSAHIIFVLRSPDVLQAIEESGPLHNPIIPETSRLIEATFDFYFSDSPFPRSVVIRPPDTLIIPQPSDTEIVQRWSSLHGFCLPLESCSASDDPAMASP